MNFFTLATSATNSGSTNAGGLGNTWIIIGIIVVFILMFVLTSIPQKKRQKQMQNMLAQIKPGDQVKTIGDMVGVVTAVNDMTGILTINVGSESVPTFINVDRVAIYSVAPLKTAEPAPVVETAPIEESAPVEENKEDK